MNSPQSRFSAADRIHSIVIALVLTAFYLPIVFGGSYLYADDYYFRQLAVEGNLNWWNNPFTQMGRPIAGLFINTVFRPIEELGAYGWVRAIGLAGTISFALVCYSFARRHKWTPFTATAIALLITTSPSWGVFNGWTACASYPLSALLAFLGGILILPSPDAGRIRPLRIAAGITLGVLATLIYQITASFIVLPFILSLRGDKTAVWNKRRIVAVITISVSTSMVFAANLLFIRLVQRFFNNPDLYRGGFVPDLGARLNLLGTEVAPNLLLQWTLYAPAYWRWITIGALVAIISGATIATVWALTQPTAAEEKPARVTGSRLLWAFPPGIIGIAPLILVNQGFFPLRMLPFAAAFQVILIMLLATPTIDRGWSPGKWVTLAGLLAFLGVQIGFGAYAFREGLVWPNVREVAAWKNFLKNTLKERPAHFTYLEPSYREGAFSKLHNVKVHVNEYGRGSASYSWIAQHAINTFLDELFPEAPQGKTARTSLPEELKHYTQACPSSPLIEGWRVIMPDNPPHQRDPTGQHMHPLLGEFAIIHNTWNLGWIGAFNAVLYPWIHHATLGWLLIDTERSEPGRLIFRSGDLHHFMMQRERLPEIYWEEGDRWIEPCELLEIVHRTRGNN